MKLGTVDWIGSCPRDLDSDQQLDGLGEELSGMLLIASRLMCFCRVKVVSKLCNECKSFHESLL